MDKLAQRLLTAFLILASGCATSNFSKESGKAPRIAVTYNFVPEKATPKTAIIIGGYRNEARQPHSAPT